MKRKKTAPTRPPFNFDPKDVRLIREAVEPYFLGTLSITLSAERQFLPDCPNVTLHIKRPLKKGFRPDVAEKYINYLGFDSQFKTALLHFYRENLPTDEEHRVDHRRTPRSKAILRLAKMFRELRGERLREILTPDDESVERWQSRLRKHDLSWKDVYIPSPVAAKVAKSLFKKLRMEEWSRKTLQEEFARHFRTLD